MNPLRLIRVRRPDELPDRELTRTVEVDRGHLAAYDRVCGFRLRDQDGRIRVKLGADRTGSGLLLLDENTEPGIHAVTGADGTALSVRGTDGQLAPLAP